MYFDVQNTIFYKIIKFVPLIYDLVYGCYKLIYNRDPCGKYIVYCRRK